MIFRNHDDAIDSAQVIRRRFDSSTGADDVVVLGAIHDYTTHRVLAAQSTIHFAAGGNRPSSVAKTSQKSIMGSLRFFMT